MAGSTSGIHLLRFIQHLNKTAASPSPSPVQRTRLFDTDIEKRRESGRDSPSNSFDFHSGTAWKFWKKSSDFSHLPSHRSEEGESLDGASLDRGGGGGRGGGTRQTSKNFLGPPPLLPPARLHNLSLTLPHSAPIAVQSPPLPPSPPARKKSFSIESRIRPPPALPIPTLLPWAGGGGDEATDTSIRAFICRPGDRPRTLIPCAKSGGYYGRVAFHAAVLSIYRPFPKKTAKKGRVIVV